MSRLSKIIVCSLSLSCCCIFIIMSLVYTEQNSSIPDELELYIITLPFMVYYFFYKDDLITDIHPVELLAAHFNSSCILKRERTVSLTYLTIKQSTYFYLEFYNECGPSTSYFEPPISFVFN